MGYTPGRARSWPGRQVAAAERSGARAELEAAAVELDKQPDRTMSCAEVAAWLRSRKRWPNRKLPESNGGKEDTSGG